MTYRDAKALARLASRAKMDDRRAFGFTGRSVTISGVLGALALVALLVGPALAALATVGDVTTFAWTLSMVPVAFGLHWIVGYSGKSASLLALIVGVVGMLIAAVLGLAVPLGYSTYELITAPSTAAFVLIGVWLLVANRLSGLAGVAPPGVIWIGTIAGICWMLTLPLFLLGGFPGANFTDLSTMSASTIVGIALGALAFVLYAVWGIWLGRKLLIRA